MPAGFALFAQKILKDCSLFSISKFLRPFLSYYNAFIEIISDL